MLTENTIQKMKELRLAGMLNAYQTILETVGANDMTVDEALAHLLDAEIDERYDRKSNRLVKASKFRYPTAAIENITYKNGRHLNKNQINRLAECMWIKKNENIILTGPTGAGKSYLACAFGHHACANGYKVKYYNTMKLLTEIKMAQADHSISKLIQKLKKQDILIFDDFGLRPLDGETRLFLLEILEDRYGNSSSIFVSQVPIKHWHKMIGNKTVADAICDRVLHNAHKINIEGESMRKKS